MKNEGPLIPKKKKKPMKNFKPKKRKVKRAQQPTRYK
jgi:hypothetical protein